MKSYNLCCVLATPGIASLVFVLNIATGGEVAIFYALAPSPQTHSSHGSRRSRLQVVKSQ